MSQLSITYYCCGLVFHPTSRYPVYVTLFLYVLTTLTCSLHLCVHRWSGLLRAEFGAFVCVPVELTYMRAPRI